ncbi:MAG: hypothetical protein HC904_04035 [Blastochloris sp.]|nr:hypothetical protein [Blastochloris sp.]
MAWGVVEGRATEDSPLAGLKKEHPRLLVDAGTWESLRQQRQDDQRLDQLLGRLEELGRLELGKPPMAYEKRGRRLLSVSRMVLRRVLLWSLNYRITGDKVFLQASEKEMLNAAGFADWNPNHFLDTAEMTAALALGYDWLYDELDPATRQALVTAIKEKGLKSLTEPKGSVSNQMGGVNS